MSVAIENFVKTIYKNNNNDSNDTKPGNIAKKLGISNAAATDMAKKLALKNLLHYKKYQPLQLTKEGERMALNVVRKHRLWESFLHKTFDMSLHDIHREAELLEHETSDFWLKKLVLFWVIPNLIHMVIQFLMPKEKLLQKTCLLHYRIPKKVKNISFRG
jgi:DtxR family Mn-dependent transcriptional regulator